MVTHPMKMVHWISIVVIHIFIILMPKDAKLIMIVQHICSTAVHNIESFDTCEPFLMGKMTKNPFSGTME